MTPAHTIYVRAMERELLAGATEERLAALLDGPERDERDDAWETDREVCLSGRRVA